MVLLQFFDFFLRFKTMSFFALKQEKINRFIQLLTFLVMLSGRSDEGADADAFILVEIHTWGEV